MRTECSAEQFEFEGFGHRRVVAAFDGGAVTSDAGGLLLRDTDRAVGLIDRVAACFGDRREQDQVVHTTRTLVGQRIVGIALGYEDVSDHDELRHDPVLALFADGLEPKRADCAPLAGKSTLNRLEHVPRQPHDRYHKIDHDPDARARLFVELFLEAHKRPPKQIILDLDATDDPLHGQQEGRFFHGYYACYCYLPLYVFCGRHLLAALLRPSNLDASAGALDAIRRIIERIRQAWPRTQILLRADSGFARDELMAWCEANRVDYVFGLARNPRLVAELEADLAGAAAEHAATGQPVRRFKNFRYATLDSWSCARRVIGKAEHLAKGPNPRFIVTSLSASVIDGQPLYERVYCARGEMENRIKEQQLDLFADRTSAATMRANQLRLWFASFAYVLLEALRRIGLRHTQFQDATLRHDPTETAQARSPGHGLGAPDQGRDRLGLSVSGRVRPCPSAARARARTAARPPCTLNPSSQPLSHPVPPRRAPPRPHAAPIFTVAHLERARSGPARVHLALAPRPTRSAGGIAPNPLSAIVSVRYPG